MNLYNYHTKDAKGAYADGTIEAADQKDAILQLGARGLFVIDLTLIGPVLQKNARSNGEDPSGGE